MDEKINYSKPYSIYHNNNMKTKRVGKKDAKTKTTQRCVIEEETETLGINLSAALQAVIDSLDNLLGYMS